MALIVCPECGKEISDQAEQCPHCGYPLRKNQRAQQAKEQREQAAVRIRRRKKGILVTAALAALALIVVLVVLVVVPALKPDIMKPFKSIGSIVTFGTYPQTESGTDSTPIEWVVLDYDAAANKSLLISRYGLDAKPYNEKFADITWEDCTLRNWLNGDFYNKAFSAAEQGAILTAAVDNSRSQGYSEWDTDGGNNTQDKVFLLSYAEAHQYFGVEHYSYYLDGSDYYNTTNVASRISPTAFAIKNGAYTDNDYKISDGAATGMWWLRSPGSSQCGAASIDIDGSLISNTVYFEDVSVRPAFWLNLESGNF